MLTSFSECGFNGELSTPMGWPGLSVVNSAVEGQWEPCGNSMWKSGACSMRSQAFVKSSNLDTVLEHSTPNISTRRIPNPEQCVTRASIGAEFVLECHCVTTHLRHRGWDLNVLRVPKGDQTHQARNRCPGQPAAPQCFASWKFLSRHHSIPVLFIFYHPHAMEQESRKYCISLKKCNGCRNVSLRAISTSRQRCEQCVLSRRFERPICKHRLVNNWESFWQRNDAVLTIALRPCHLHKLPIVHPAAGYPIFVRSKGPHRV